jgi:hypothetical protein
MYRHNTVLSSGQVPWPFELSFRLLLEMASCCSCFLLLEEPSNANDGAVKGALLELDRAFAT